MSRHSVIHRLELMWKGITVAAQIDPFVEEVLLLIPNGTVIIWSIGEKGNYHIHSVRKEGLRFRLEENPSKSKESITFHTDSPHALYQVLTARMSLAELIASNIVKACGPSSITMALVQVNMLSIPYVYGMRKAKIVSPYVHQPLNYPKQRLRFMLRFLTTKGVS